MTLTVIILFLRMDCIQITGTKQKYGTKHLEFRASWLSPTRRTDISIAERKVEMEKKVFLS